MMTWQLQDIPAGIRFLGRALAWSWLTLNAQVARGMDDPPTQPNVLLIYADDLNMDLHAFGHPVVQTPNLDRLAAHGVRFSRAYCPLPLCLPSRIALLSGQRPTRTGCFNNSDIMTEPVINGVPVLPEQFRISGYSTGGAGKVFHDGAEVPGAWNEYYAEWDDWWVDKPDNPVPGDNRVIYWGGFLNGSDGSKGKQSDTKNADHVIDMLKRLKEPFFVAMGFHSPHIPFIYPERFAGLYDPNADVPALPPEESNGNWKKDGIPPDAYTSQNYLDPKYQNDPERGRREATVACWRTLTWIDEEIGRILDALEQSGAEDSTIVVFVSDHGYTLGTHAKYGKFTAYESDVRAPLLVAVPWLQAMHGRSCDVAIEQIDLYPTLMELCGLGSPANLQGESLVTLLQDVSDSARGPAFTMLPRAWYSHVQRVVRSTQYKFVFWEEGQHMLFDLKNDPGEYYNLYNDSGYGSIINQHLDMLESEGLLRADSNPFSLGWPGTNGAPELSLTAPPVLGSSLSLKVTSSSPRSELGAVFFGRNSSFIDSPWGGPFLIRPSTVYVFTLKVPDTYLSFKIPDDSRIKGLSLVLQLFQEDPGAPAGIASSRGLRAFLWDQ